MNETMRRNEKAMTNATTVSAIERDILDLARSGAVSNERLADLVEPHERHLVSSALHNLLAGRAVMRLADGSIALA